MVGVGGTTGGGGGAGGGPAGSEGGGGGGGEEKVRNPRWMMHETVVLVAAKRKHDEEAGDEYVPAHKKWGAIAVDVKENGVDRDARQCRKRWSNLYQDYRRIRDWLRKSGVESYWTMRHDKRRDNKLPGSFDPEVYADMDAFLSKKRGITPRTASDSAQPMNDEGLGSEIEQDHEGHDAADVGSGDGSCVPGIGMDKEQPTDSAGDDRKKRNSKWTKHETVVLLVGKSKYDSKAKEMTASSKAVRSDEKWDSISAYCKSNGVDRDAQQCRKRWSNLHNGDYKKIRDWQKANNVESYWTMKSEKRRQNKLPGFFDAQVYAVMEAFCAKKANGDLDGARPGFEELLLSEVEQDHEEQNGAPDVGRTGAAPAPESGTLSCRVEQPGVTSVGASVGRKKRKRIPNGTEADEHKDHKDHLTAILESTGKAMQVALTENIQAQIEAHKRNSELDRNQRKQQGDNLVGVLSKLAEAMAKIAEKL